MGNIHLTAIVSKKAQIDPSVEIGPNCVIEDDVKISKGTKLLANVYICSGTTVGKENIIHMGAILGNEPQDVSFKKGTKSYLNIGDRNIIREYVTIHRGTQEGSCTTVGNGNFFMALSHIAHNCNIGNDIVICNNSPLGGYVEVEDKAFISGNSAVHQYCRIGRLAMISGLTRIAKDVPPYMVAELDSVISGYNIIGLRRAGVSQEAREQIKQAYKLLYLSGLNTSHALDQIEKQFKSDEIKYLVEFIRNSKRGICRHKSQTTQGDFS